MNSDASYPTHLVNCDIAVHGNGFLANVRTYKMTPSGCYPIGAESLKPGDSIRLEIAPEQGGPLTVRLGVVRWIDGDTVEVEVMLMNADDKQKMNEIAWSSVRGEVKVFHWLRSSLWGDDIRHLTLSYVPRVCEHSARMLAAA